MLDMVMCQEHLASEKMLLIYLGACGPIPGLLAEEEGLTSPK